MVDVIGWLHGSISAAEAKAVCESRALFLSGSNLAVIFLIFFFITPLAAALNGYLIKLCNPKLSEPLQTTASPHVVITPPEGEAPPETPPPAYAESLREAHRRQLSLEDHPSSYVDIQWSVNDSKVDQEPYEATQFVKGSVAFTTLLFMLFLLAIAIQSLTYCRNAVTVLVVFMWIIFGGLCLFSLRGLGAWLVLLRNLWGKRGRERFVFRDDAIVNFLFGFWRLPFIAMVSLVWACQRRFCGADDREEDVELGITPSSARFPPDSSLPRDPEQRGKGSEEAKVLETDEPLDERAAESQGLLAGQERDGTL